MKCKQKGWMWLRIKHADTVRLIRSKDDLAIGAVTAPGNLPLMEVTDEMSSHENGEDPVAGFGL